MFDDKAVVVHNVEGKAVVFFACGHPPVNLDGLVFHFADDGSFRADDLNTGDPVVRGTMHRA